jgi:hypothetical protein
MSTLILNIHDQSANVAKAAIIAKLGAGVDAGNKILLKSCGPGIAVPNAENKGLLIEPKDCPAVRVFDAPESAEIQGQDMVDSEWRSSLWIFGYLYMAPDAKGRTPDFQAEQRKFARWVLRQLWAPDTGSTDGLTPDHTKWAFRPQTVRIDYATALRDFQGSGGPVLPPWYVFKMEVEIWSWNVFTDK